MDTTNELNNEKRGISWHDWLERNRLQDLRGVALRAKLTKCASIAALLLAVVFWGSSANYQVLLRFAVCAGAARVAFLAAEARKEGWVTLFLGVSMLYNPVFPLFELAGGVAFLLEVATMAAFASSMFLLKPRLAA